jgi:integrase
MPTIHLRNNTIVLYKRPESPKWQAELRYPEEGTVRKISTRIEDEHEAAIFAFQLYEEQRASARLPKPKIPFGEFCKKYRCDVLTKPIQKPIYATYLRHLENYVEPFFGSMETITQEQVDEFYNWYAAKIAEKTGDLPSKSTINSMNVVLRSVFRIARAKDFVNELPTFSVRDRGREGDVREAFSLEDYRTLYKASRAWKKEKTHRKISAYKRQILHEMILIIANTGIRPGTETRNLEWRNVIYTPEYVKVRIYKGKKKKPRTAIARASARVYFDRLKELTGHQELCFCMPDGSPFRWEHHMFDDLLEFAKLPKHYTLYGLRHMYATQRLIRQRVPYAILAKQMGTSPKMLAEHYDQSVVEAFSDYFVE